MPSSFSGQVRVLPTTRLSVPPASLPRRFPEIPSTAVPARPRRRPVPLPRPPHAHSRVLEPFCQRTPWPSIKRVLLERPLGGYHWPGARDSRRWGLVAGGREARGTSSLILRERGRGPALQCPLLENGDNSEFMDLWGRLND